MSQRKLDTALYHEAVALVKKHGSQAAASRATGLSRTTIQSRLLIGESQGKAPAPEKPTDASIMEYLRAGAHTLDSIQNRFSITKQEVVSVIERLEKAGYNVFTHGDGKKMLISIESVPVPKTPQGDHFVYDSDADGRYKFGVVSDTHLGSKYYRPDVLNELYDWFEREGVSRVFHAGNWIEGEARFNKFDVSVHGMDAQCRYMAKHYPQRKGITTYAVTGDDHEGWYNQREGVDIGRYQERIMQDCGRTDWVNLGYMEAFIALRHAKTHRTSQMLVMHPGGGSAYALSYQPQKIVESLAGGEKPAVLLIGHYHKLEWINIRNTWVLQCGTTKDQDPFLRKKRIEVHIGGTIMELRQDKVGAIPDAIVWMKRFYNSGYYQDRFSHSGEIVLPSMMSGSR